MIIDALLNKSIVKAAGAGLAMWLLWYLVWTKPQNEFRTKLEVQKTICNKEAAIALIERKNESDQMISSINLVGKANNILREKIAEMNSTKRTNKVMCQIKAEGLETTLRHCQSDLDAVRSSKEITYVKDKSCTNIDFHALSS